MSEKWTKEEISQAKAEAGEMFEYFHPEIKGLRERNARLVAAIENAIQTLELDGRHVGSALYNRLREALANQQSTEKP